MAFTCIPKDKAEQFRRALKGNKINIPELMKKSSKERREIFREFAPDKKTAKEINTLFEEKLILKNRIQGLKNWAKKVGQIGRYDPKKAQQMKEALSEYKKMQEERILNPKENEAFLKDLAETKLGTRISESEASKLWGLKEKANRLKKDGYKPETENSFGEWVSKDAKRQHGAAQAMYERYLANLKTKDMSLMDLAKQYLKEKKFDFQENIPVATGKLISDTIKTMMDVSVNIVASLDNSFLVRQGAITLVKNPSIWWSNAKQSFKDIIDTFGEQKAQDALMADAFSRPNYIEGVYEKMGLEGFKGKKAKMLREEEAPVSGIMEKIPFIGKVFKASDIAFNGSALRVRMDLADHFYKMYKSMGVEMTDALLKDIGKHVNAITARGKMGRFGGSRPVNLLLWAPRMLKADWDILTAHTGGAGLTTNTMRLAAARTIAQVMIGSAGAVGVTESINPGSVELDPRSTAFGEVQVEDTQIPVHFGRGMAQIVTLAARMITQQTKSSKTDIIRDLNTGEFGSQTLFDVGIDFLANKTQPLVNTAIRFLEGRTFEGEKPDLANTIENNLPISIQNFNEIRDLSGEREKRWAALGAFLDVFGISAQTYTLKDNWEMKDTDELNKFKNEVGEETFKEANKEFNDRYNDWVKQNVDTVEYRKMSNEDKEEFIRDGKSKIKDEVLQEFRGGGEGINIGEIDVPSVDIPSL